MTEWISDGNLEQKNKLVKKTWKHNCISFSLRICCCHYTDTVQKLREIWTSFKTSLPREDLDGWKIC